MTNLQFSDMLTLAPFFWGEITGSCMRGAFFLITHSNNKYCAFVEEKQK
jgi:hypothetical protein